MSTLTPDPEYDTPVVFRAERSGVSKGDVTAVFPCDPAGYTGYGMGCYAHVGQHSACCIEWYNQTRPATPEEYADLKHELESEPYNYRLKIYRRITHEMHDVRMAEQRRLNSFTG